MSIHSCYSCYIHELYVCSGVIIPHSHLRLSLFPWHFSQCTTDGLGKARPAPTYCTTSCRKHHPATTHTKYVCVHMHTHVLRGLCCCLCWMHTHTTCMHTHSMLGGYAAACVRMISHYHIVEPYHVHPIGCIQMNVTLYVAMVQQLCPTCTHPQCIGGRLAIRGSSLMMCKVVYTYMCVNLTGGKRTPYASYTFWYTLVVLSRHIVYLKHTRSFQPFLQ